MHPQQENLFGKSTEVLQQSGAITMEKILIMGDIYTVTSFSLSGIEGMVAGPDDAELRFRDLLAREDAGIIMITRDLSQSVTDIISDVNHTAAKPLIIEIPGIEATEDIRRSVLEYVTQSLNFMV